MNRYIFLLMSLIILSCGREAVIRIYPAPDGEPMSTDFEVHINNEKLPIYLARVSKYPINQIWPGFQRPLNQTELASFGYFDINGEAEIRITSTVRDISSVKILPVEFGIEPKVEENTLSFIIDKPCQLSIEVNNYHSALHLFANPFETENYNINDTSVHYFGPGIHKPGIIDVKSNETVYLAGGAVVHGIIRSEGTEGIKIRGRGILDASTFERNKAPNPITFLNVRDASVEGIILRDPQEWGIVPTNCRNIVFDNLKLIGFWRYNADGIDIVNCNDIVIKNSFIRSFDDNIVVRGTPGAYIGDFRSISDIMVDSCVLWNDWGRALEIGASTVADTIHNIHFSNIYIPHFVSVALDIQNCDRGLVKDIYFRNIYIGEPISDSARLGITPIVPQAWGKSIVLGVYGSFYSYDSIRGRIESIKFENIRYEKGKPVQSGLTSDDVVIDPGVKFRDYDIFVRDNMYFGDIRYNCSNQNTVYFSGYNDAHGINDIEISGYYLNGIKQADLTSIGMNSFVKNISIK